MVVYCLVLFSSHVEAQTVQLIQSPDIAILGETSTISCLSTNFDQTQDLVEIRFGSEQLIQVLDGVIVYNERPGAYTIQSTDSGVVLTVNEVNKNDAGTYKCIVNKAGAMFSSQEIRVVVKEFPRPTCFGPSENSNSYAYSIINNDKILTTEPSVTVSFVCSVSIDDNDVHVIPRWSRSDGKAISQTQPFLTTAIVTFTSTMEDDGIHFICTSQNSTYASITKMCSIHIFVTPTFNLIGSTVSREPSKPTTKAELGASATTPLTTTKVESGVPTTQMKAGMSSGTPATKLPLPLIVGVSVGTGILLLIFIVVMVCLCMTRCSKQTLRRSSNNDDLKLVITQRYSEMDVSSAGHPKSEGIYENTDHSKLENPTVLNKEEESDGASSSHVAKSSQSRFNYKNNENAHFVLPPLKDNKQMNHSKSPGDTNVDISNFAAEKDAKDKKVNNLNLATNNDYHSHKMKGNKDNIRAAKPSTDSEAEPPVYADVKKNKKKGTSSIVLNREVSIPAYAMVNKDRDRDSKIQSRVPAVNMVNATNK